MVLNSGITSREGHDHNNSLQVRTATAPYGRTPRHPFPLHPITLHLRPLPPAPLRDALWLAFAWLMAKRGSRLSVTPANRAIVRVTPLCCMGGVLCVQNPHLPDWAVMDVTVAPTRLQPGGVVAADFFDEAWQLK